MVAYKRESKKELMNGRLKIRKPKKNSKKLSLNLSTNFIKVDDQKIRLIFTFTIHFFIELTFGFLLVLQKRKK